MPITPNSARAYYGLQATAEPTKTQVSGAVTIGLPSSVMTLTGATKAYCVSATLATSGDTLTIDTETGIATIGTAPVSQVETATVVAPSGATSSGNLLVAVTSARETETPPSFSVALVNGVDTTAALIAAKIRAALSANAALTEVYAVGGTGADVTLTEKIATNNDATLNIAITAGLGVSAITTSTNTTAGVGGVKLTNGTGDGKDFEGASLGTMSKIHGFIFKNTGTGGLGVEIGTGDYATGIVAGDIATMFSTVGRTNLIGNLEFQALDDNAAVEVTIIAQ